jgi:CRP/FNR family transcriptional regulator, anaerobic regulatory protein
MVDIKTIKEFYHRHFEDALLEEMAQVGTLHTFEEHDLLIDFQQKITTMPLLLEGAIKIMREDFDEGELLLYYLEKGDTCAMTMACCIGDKKSDIRAIAETNGVMLLVPVQKMSEWMAKYSSWRSFVMNSYQDRLDEMMRAIDNLAFNDMNQRLKNYLIELASVNKSHTVNKTHQEIAYELNTSRVVISRLLKALEKEDFLVLNRNTIHLNV